MANAAAGSSSNSTIKEEGYDDDCQLNNDDDQIREWVKSIEQERREVRPLQSEYSIFRVPQRLRKLTPEAYTPQSVSIGPLHYNEKHLQPMQATKLHYLNSFLHRHKRRTVDDYVKAVSKLEKEARKCYSETNGRGFEKKEFVKMMVIDGCFILELCEIIRKEEKDDLCSNPSQFWEVLSDLIKLENQLPFSVLQCLYGLTYGTPNTCGCDLYEYILWWFGRRFHGKSEPLIPIEISQGRAKHLLDILHRVVVNSSKRKMKDGEGDLDCSSCASELKRAGVKFKSSPNTSLFDIAFDKGVLTIPTIVIFDTTEHTFRNLIAFEQGQDNSIAYFTAYAAFMDGLIDTQRDVELLEKKGIIENNLGDPEDVVTLFNNIVKRVTVKDHYFSSVIEDVKNYQKKPWNRRRASLMENYFNTPWALLSLLAALFLLILTVIQTICSILQVVWTKPP